MTVARGTQESGQKWMEDFKTPFPLYLDMERVLYRTVGLRRTLKASWNLTIFIYYADAVMAGRKDRKAYSGDDLTVMGGDFIVDSSGQLLFAHPSKEQYDRPYVAKLLETLRQCSNPAVDQK